MEGESEKGGINSVEDRRLVTEEKDQGMGNAWSDRVMRAVTTAWRLQRRGEQRFPCAGDSLKMFGGKEKQSKREIQKEKEKIRSRMGSIWHTGGLYPGVSYYLMQHKMTDLLGIVSNQRDAE